MMSPDQKTAAGWSQDSPLHGDSAVKLRAHFCRWEGASASLTSWGRSRNNATITAPQTAGITAEARGCGWASALLCSGWQPGRGWLGTHTTRYSSGHSWASSCYSPEWVGCGAGGFLWTSTPPPTALLQFSSLSTTTLTKHFFDEKKQKARAWLPFEPSLGCKEESPATQIPLTWG